MLKDFKKVSSDKSSTTFQHPDGHVIRIAHQHLSKKVQGDLKTLKMADGGEVTDSKKKAPKEQENTQQALPISKETLDEFSNAFSGKNVNEKLQPNAYAEGTPDEPIQSEDVPQQEPQSLFQTILGNVKSPQAADSMTSSENQAPVDPTAGLSPSPSIGGSGNIPLQAPQQQTNPLAQQGQGYMQQLQGGMEQQKQGIQQEAKAQGALGQQQADVLQKAETSQNALMADYQNKVSHYQQQNEALTKAYQDGTIDPQRKWHSMSTGQRVAAVIGIALGGISQAFIGGQNPALQMLNRAVDQDIEQQRTDLGKVPTLLEANYKQMGNLNDATKMTWLQKQDLVKSEIEQAAAKSQDPIQKARAQAAIGQLTQQQAPVLAQLAQSQALLQAHNNGNVDPAAVIRVLVPPQQQQKALDELKDAQNKTSSAKQALKVFDDLNHKFLAGALTRDQRAASIDPIAVSMARDAAGRVNEFEFNAMQKLFPAAGDFTQTRALKRQRLQEFIGEKMHFPTLDLYGITPKAPNTNVSPIEAPKGYKR